MTALVGLAVGGGVIWVVRMIGTAVLRREAMGFGDVTLMSMIGTFVGWQASLIVFFSRRFSRLVIAVVQWVLHRERRDSLRTVLVPGGDDGDRPLGRRFWDGRRSSRVLAAAGVLLCAWC